MEFSPEKMLKLRELIQDQLSEVNIKGHIDEAIGNIIPENDGNRSERDVFDDLKRKGIIEEIMEKLKLDSSNSSPDQSVKNESKQIKDMKNPPCRYIYLQVLRGKAFLEHLDATENLENSFFKIHIHFRGQRFHSKCVPVACEPDFSEGFLLELKTNRRGNPCGLIGMDTLLSICDPIHIILTKHDANGDCFLVSSHALEWRNALTLTTTSLHKAIELMGVGTECKVHAGVLEVQFQVLPAHQMLSIAPKVIEAQLHLERQRCSERDRLFLTYAKQWWKEYIQVRDEHKSRPVKIFAQDETGVNRPVCAYVQPLKGERLITSPRMAARFVSTLSCEKASFVGTGNKVEQWQSLHAFLCSKKGDHEDHSNLLCSLLLGFGLDAYVCIGLKTSNHVYSWVVTRYCDDSTVFFWDPITGRRYAHHRVEPDDPPAIHQPVTNHPFKVVGCIYNHNSFYANTQPFDFAETVDFNIDNQSLWKQMSPDAISSVTGQAHPNICRPLPPLQPPTINGASISNDLEMELKMLVSQYRKDIDLTTEWDNNLSYLLLPSLFAYETEKSCGLSNIGNDDFQDAIRRAVPEGNTFKGFPMQVLHSDPQKAFKTCLKSKICLEILECRGDNVRLAVCCYCTVFADDSMATWIMFACRYRSVL